MEPATDDPIDSIVRTRIYFALTRAGIPLSIPAQSVFVTEDSAERREHKSELDFERRVAHLSQIDLFRDFSSEERAELARALSAAPFTAGEVLTREGSDAHHLYVVREGRVSVRVGSGKREREVAQLGSGQFFGEMSLLTGEKRSATVVALTDVHCYRLDADAFRRVLARRPDVAEKVATQLAERRAALLATLEQLPDRERRVDADRLDLLERIRSFFGL
jgi:CRP-like cAMP-binding protein